MSTRIRLIGPHDAQDDDLVDALGALLAARHRGHRVASPLLDPRYEDATVNGGWLRTQLSDGRVSGAVVEQDATPSGFLVGRTGDGPPWGRSVWMDSGSVVAPDAETL